MEVSGVGFQVSGWMEDSDFGGWAVTKKNYMDVEDLEVYKKLCQLHIEVCDLTRSWPHEEKYELGGQSRRSSNSSPAQLAEKNDDPHIRNKIEGVNRSRGEAAETIHHLYMAKLKGYIAENIYLEFRGRYKECIRMLNGLEKTLERKLPERDRRWQVKEESIDYGSKGDTHSKGWPADVY
jgi:four helix bundle protein